MSGGLPGMAAMSTPSLCWPVPLSPKGEMTWPRSGQMNRPRPAVVIWDGVRPAMPDTVGVTGRARPRLGA